MVPRFSEYLVSSQEWSHSAMPHFCFMALSRGIPRHGLALTSQAFKMPYWWSSRTSSESGPNDAGLVVILGSLWWCSSSLWFAPFVFAQHWTGGHLRLARESLPLSTCYCCIILGKILMNSVSFKKLLRLVSCYLMSLMSFIHS